MLKFLLKVENATNGAISFEKEVSCTVANAWEDLVFDYSAVSTTQSYQKIVLIFDLGIQEMVVQISLIYLMIFVKLISYQLL